MAFVVTYVADVLQTFMLNEEYETVLRPKIANNVEELINAMCTYLSNPALHVCLDAKKKKKITKEQYDELNSPIDYTVERSKEFIKAYLDSVKKPNMLEYIPPNQQISVPMLGGGDSAGSGVPNMEIPTIVPNSLPITNPISNLETGSMSPDKLISGVDSAIPISIPGLEIGKVVKDSFKSNKATDIMEFLMEQVILKLKCDNNMHELIKEKIIGSIFKVASKHVHKFGSELLLPVVKVSTEQHVHKCVPLLTKQLNNYQQLLGIMASISSTDSGKNAITVIIPHCMDLLFELFVYCEYGLIVEIDVGITRNGIKPYVSSLNDFKEEVNANLGKYNYPADVMHLNTIKMPDSWKTEGTGDGNSDGNGDGNGTVITDAVVIAEFKKLFEPDAAKKKGGSLKTRTRKHKTKDLPVTKHGSRRKHP
jgi:hypothetical protein